jgi:hypothetical protein
MLLYVPKYGGVWRLLIDELLVLGDETSEQHIKFPRAHTGRLNVSGLFCTSTVPD